MPGRRHARPRGTRTSFMVRWAAECKIGPTGFGWVVPKIDRGPDRTRGTLRCPYLLLIPLRDPPDPNWVRRQLDGGFPTDSAGLGATGRTWLHRFTLIATKRLRAGAACRSGRNVARDRGWLSITGVWPDQGGAQFAYGASSPPTGRMLQRAWQTRRTSRR